MVITGQLIRIDFGKHRVDILYPVTNKTLSCNYKVDSEDLLIQNRREFVQVKGSFELDDTGNPVDVIEVTQIEPLDLSLMIFDKVEWEGQMLFIDPPLTLEPKLDKESSQLLTIEYKELNLCAFAPTREALEDEIVQQLFFLWNEYVLEEAEKLAPAAKQLQQALKSRTRESAYATGP